MVAKLPQAICAPQDEFFVFTKRLATLIGALYLNTLDRALMARAEAYGGFYIRFMDDWLFLCNSKWHLRKAVRRMNRVLVDLKVTKAVEKTFIGKVERGFYWLGYDCSTCFNAAITSIHSVDMLSVDA